jgi:hypothetical protein
MFLYQTAIFLFKLFDNVHYLYYLRHKLIIDQSVKINLKKSTVGYVT